MKNNIDSDLLERLNRKFGSLYPDEQILKEFRIEVSINGDGKPPSQSIKDGGLIFKRTFDNNQEIILLKPLSFTISRVAPYTGWEKLLTRFTRDWGTWKAVTGHKPLSRVGMRYINRIDIPDPSSGLIPQNDYLRIWAQSPDTLGPTLGYSVQCISFLPNISSKIVINSATVPASIVPGHTSFVLDIDIGRDFEVPQRDDKIVDLLSQMRLEKNRIFESCITDKARELFR